jgi:hypothetical protein
MHSSEQWWVGDGGQRPPLSDHRWVLGESQDGPGTPWRLEYARVSWRAGDVADLGRSLGVTLGTLEAERRWDESGASLLVVRADPAVLVSGEVVELLAERQPPTAQAWVEPEPAGSVVTPGAPSGGLLKLTPEGRPMIVYRLERWLPRWRSWLARWPD